jgi:hypothetical protein
VAAHPLLHPCAASLRQHAFKIGSHSANPLLALPRRAEGKAMGNHGSDPDLRASRRRRVAFVMVAVLLAIGAMSTVSVDESASAAPTRSRGAYASGRAAVDRLGTDLPAVAAEHRLDPGTLRRMLLTDPTLAVDRDGELAYFEELPPYEPAVPATTLEADLVTVSSSADHPEFGLASLPGAAHTIYLDFDGHTTTGTTWNTQFGMTNLVSPPFDRDGDPTTWSPLELQIIRNSWAVVAEDFAPWQVNVTTIDPGPEALRYTGQGDTAWGVRVVITKDTFANCNCGGHAYIGSFTDNQDEPIFVYNSSFVGISEAISHEVGHALFLAHDGTTSGGAYYVGHDHGGPGWAPIMGAAYYRQVSQWSQGEYFDADNSGSSANYGLGPDDVAIISDTTIGNLPIRPDDHGSFDAPTILTPAAPSAAGIIETRTDIDAFSFTTPAGVVTIAATPAPVGPNLDIALTLRDESGGTIATSSPIDALDADIVAIVPAGTYVVELEGAGVGNPFLNPPSGYTDYGSLGQYTIAWSVDAAELPDTTPPEPPTGLTAAATGGDVELTWNANAEADLAGYVVQRDGGAGFVDRATVATSEFTDRSVPAGAYAYRVLAVDETGNRSTGSNVATILIDGPSISVASGDEAIAGAVVGSFTATNTVGGAVQTITEVPSDGKPRSRHDLLEHRWTIPASIGRHTLTVHASTTDGGDADDGVLFEVSDDAVRWAPVLHVPAGSAVSTSVDIGRRAGTVHVRVIDTDRSISQQRADSVRVDYLAVHADGGADDGIGERPGPSVMVVSVATLTWGSQLGRQHGVAVATVTDDQGDPVEGALVEVRFGAPFASSASAQTGVGGVAHIVTSTSARKPPVSACVVSATGPLPYSPGSEGC